ncbi:DCC1-like thiol-disulfide oxidoreductase family protein [Alkalimarinus coralli]|uniref:DCC1-like thiol-disulfide oxidoreductase family protein n=1 Tax=Alkalimarinus coralli TaxID=2935863 RepID=UPI00202B027F|nr:DCC1-like thiol-disulfide oxidoreductase family protein [Alkalimarinus coralli]
MKSDNSRPKEQKKIRVYYDASCAGCRRDRKRYDQIAGKDKVEWCDITGNDEQLKAQGIDPEEAVVKLHVQNTEGVITNDIEAYVLLISEIPWLKPLAWLLNLKWIKETLRYIYRRWVLRRLRKEGRLNS